MKTELCFAAALLFGGSAWAQEAASGLKLRDLKSQNAAQLSKDELQQTIAGAKVTSVTTTGSTRYWVNNPDGKFIASTDNRGGAGYRTTGQGTWHIADNATYCVQIEWSRRSEQWCRYLFKAGDKYYGVSSLADDATVAHELAFSK